MIITIITIITIIMITMTLYEVKASGFFLLVRFRLLVPLWITANSDFLSSLRLLIVQMNLFLNYAKLLFFNWLDSFIDRLDSIAVKQVGNNFNLYQINYWLLIVFKTLIIRNYYDCFSLFRLDLISFWLLLIV
jgi:hypothetical protein